MAENITAAAVLAAVFAALTWLLLKSKGERCQTCNSMRSGWSSNKVADLDARPAYFECEKCGNRIPKSRLDERGHAVRSDGSCGVFLENNVYVHHNGVGSMFGGVH